MTTETKMTNNITEEIINAVSERKTVTSIDGIEMMIESYCGDGFINVCSANGQLHEKNVSFKDFINGNVCMTRTAKELNGYRDSVQSEKDSLVHWTRHRKEQKPVPIDIRPSDLDVADGRSYVIRRHPSTPHMFIGERDHVKFTICIEQGEYLKIRQLYPDGRIMFTKYNQNGFLMGKPHCTNQNEN